MVLTRDITERVGRASVVAKILEGLSRDNDVTPLRLRSLLETRSAADLAVALAVWLWSLIRLRPMPLQCLLYSSHGECARLVRRIRDGAFSTVYLDTVRCQMLLRMLRRALPDIFIVTDFDDLMSRRMRYLAEHRLPLLVGHTGAVFPNWLRKLAEGPLARLVTHYEAASLRHAEQEAAHASNIVVLLSDKERMLLRENLAPQSRAIMHAIPPPMAVRSPPWATAQAIRFVFVGSDRQLQNRTAIDYLLERWRLLRPAATLYIYSAQTRPQSVAPGVEWRGFAPDLREVYRPGSVLLLPALASGGIKTKVAEAWSFGCPVLGNAAAFEGLAIENYPLNLPEALWPPLLTDPDAHAALWAEAAARGHDFVARHLSPQRFDRDWANAIGIRRGALPASEPRQAFAAARLKASQR